jgi:hypothetical protein
MEGTNFKHGISVGDHDAKVQVADQDGYLYQQGEKVTLPAAVMNKVAGWFIVTALDGTTGKKACVTNGVSAIAGGTGIEDMTLAAPSPGDLAIIRIDSISDGTVKVTCAEGVTVDGTNDIMTFDAAGEAIVLAYKAANEWQIVLNIGGVALS